MRRLVGILATLGLLLGLVPIVGPAAMAVPCGGPKVTLYEDVFGFGDSTVYCNGKGNADLKTHPHAQAGVCATQFDQPGDTWDNCVSSIRMAMGAGHCLYLYSGVNYVGFYHGFAGPSDAVISWPTLNNDILTSFRFKAKVGGLCPGP